MNSWLGKFNLCFANIASCSSAKTQNFVFDIRFDTLYFIFILYLIFYILNFIFIFYILYFIFCRSLTIEMPLGHRCNCNPTVKTSLSTHLKLTTILKKKFDFKLAIIPEKKIDFENPHQCHLSQEKSSEISTKAPTPDTDFGGVHI